MPSLAPLCTVSVYNAGTAVFATIFDDLFSTPKDNPFTADVNAYWYCYAAPGVYDVQFSGAGIPTPYVISGVVLTP